MSDLITGGSGLVGAELAHLLVEKGEDVVIFDIVKGDRLVDIEDKIKFVQGDLANFSEVLNVVRDNGINRIYHLGAMLTFDSEKDPWTSFQTNVVGTFNTFEAARLFKVEKLIFTSSIGTFETSGSLELTDVTLQRPESIYGVSKLYGEGLGRFYRRRFGLDFRAVRYPSVIGRAVTAANHWDAPMIEAAVAGRPFQCSVPASFAQPLLYYKDAAGAAYLLAQAARQDILTLCYNIAGTGIVAARKLEKSIRRHYPDFKVHYPDDRGVRSRTNIWDDSRARSEWGWQREYSDLDTLVTDFVREMTRKSVNL